MFRSRVSAVLGGRFAQRRWANNLTGIAVVLCCISTAACGRVPSASSWPGVYPAMKGDAGYVAVGEQLLSVISGDGAVRIASLSAGEETIEGTIRTDGEVLEVRAVPVGDELWIAVQVCKGKIVQDDMTFCEGESEIAVYAGAPDDQRLVASLSRDSESGVDAQRLHNVVSYRDGVLLSVSALIIDSEDDVKRVAVSRDSVRALQKEGDDSLGAACESDGVLYSLVSHPNMEQFRNEDFQFRKLDGGEWKTIELPEGPVKKSYDMQLVCNKSNPILLFAEQNDAEVYRLESGSLVRVAIDGDGPAMIHQDWALDGVPVLSRVQKNGSYLAWLLAGETPRPVQLHINLETSGDRVTFVGMSSATVVVGTSSESQLEVHDA